MEPCGTECWQIRSRTRRGYGSATKFPRTLGEALRICAERDLRDGEGDCGLDEAMDRYGEIAGRIESAEVTFTKSEEKKEQTHERR